MKQIRYILWTGAMVLLLSLTATLLRAEEWAVPADRNAEAAPFKFTDETRQKGAALFTKNCQSCHGVPTKANWANIQPPPGDPASEKFRKDTDGALFYKISTGRGPMPQFMNILSDEDRWNIISYIRSFHPGYVQPNPELAMATAKGGRSTIVIKTDTANHRISFTVTNKKANVVSPAANAGILVFVKRYFGNLQVGTAKTNAAGSATFAFTDSIPGDSQGNLIIIARLDESSGYGGAEQIDTVPFGKPSHWVSLTEPRAMWNVRAKAPVWLVLTYCLGVVGVFATLFYIILRIKKIYDLGK